VTSTFPLKQQRGLRDKHIQGGRWRRLPEEPQEQGLILGRRERGTPIRRHDCGSGNTCKTCKNCNIPWHTLCQCGFLLLGCSLAP
jgi:hypothetical protein